MKTLKVFTIAFVVCFSAFAQWSTNPAENTPVCVYSELQNESCMINDGSGNVIIGWRDTRNEPVLGGDIYVQKLNTGTGNPQWTVDGKKINVQNGVQLNLDMCADGSGGALLVWQVNYGVFGNYDLFAQHINANGDLLWSSGELAISQELREQENPRIVSDGSGGAIIVWDDNRNIIGKREVFAQRVDASGNILWNAGGKLISSVPAVPGSIRIISDNDGGAILVWADTRTGIDENIYCQRIDGNGNKLWNSNDIELCNAVGNQSLPQLISDGNQGAFFVWGDNRNGFGTSDIYAQYVNAQGVIQWDTNGKVICDTLSVQSYPQIISDSQGGAIIVWDSEIVVNDRDIYAQRINSLGNTIWLENGVQVTDIDGNQTFPVIASDGLGGAIITWIDFQTTLGDLAARRIDDSGNIIWSTYISATAGGVDDPQTVPDGLGGAIICWTDMRQTPQWDIYAQNVDHNGSLGTITFVGENNSKLVSFKLFQNYPNPFNPSTKISWQAPVSGWQTIKLFDLLGKEIETIVDGYYEAGNHSTLYIVNSTSPSGVYFYQLKAGEFIQTKKMIYLK